MRPDLELLARLLVDVRPAENRVLADLRRKGDGSRDAGPGALRRLDDVGRRAVEKLVIERLEADPDLGRFGHGLLLSSNSRICVTTPAPTVLPPSRIAKRIWSSRATGVMSETTIVTVSPGMTILVPSGSSQVPVTSVVRT